MNFCNKLRKKGKHSFFSPLYWNYWVDEIKSLIYFSSGNSKTKSFPGTPLKNGNPRYIFVILHFYILITCLRLASNSCNGTLFIFLHLLMCTWITSWEKINNRYNQHLPRPLWREFRRVHITREYKSRLCHSGNLCLQDSRIKYMVQHTFAAAHGEKSLTLISTNEDIWKEN